AGLISIPSTRMTTFTGPLISAPSLGSAKNTLPLGFSFPHPTSNRNTMMQTADKFNRYRMRISRPPWARNIFVPDSRAASLLISSQLYERTRSQSRDFLSRSSFQCSIDSLHSIEHPVYDDSGHGNIEPDGKGPTSDAPVPVEAFFKGPKERRSEERRVGKECRSRW